MDELPEYGPAFQSLNERQRKFVLAMASDPYGSQADWARAAGYSDVSDAAKVRGCLLMQDSRVEAAAFEIARATLGTMGPLIATQVLLRAAANPKHPQQVKAAELIANRVGLQERQEIHVKHTDLTGEALMARLTAVAERLGLDAQKLIGSNVIDAEATEVPVSDGSDRG